MKYTIAVLAAVSSLASAQLDLSSIPPCASNCVTSAGLTAPGCQPGDFACACSNESWIGGISCCLVKCTREEQAQAIQLAQTLCGTAGVTVPSEVSCPSASSAAAESTPAAESATTESSAAASPTTTDEEEEETTTAAGAVADVASSASSAVSSAASSASSAVSSVLSSASSAASSAASANGNTTRTNGNAAASPTASTPATFSGAAAQITNGLGLAGVAAVVAALL